MPKVKIAESKSNGSNLDFEAQLWAAADKMRGHMDDSEYNGARPEGLCLGLIFLKYISDAFEEKREQLLFGFSDPKSECFIKDEPQRAEAAESYSLSASTGERAGVRWRCPQFPPEARWHTIKARAKSPEIGKVIDDAMGAIERENPTLKGVLPRDYARPSLDKVRLGGLVDIISNIGFNESAAKSKDVLGRIYEYFLGKFASAEGTLQSANTNCSNRRMQWVFSLSASTPFSASDGEKVAQPDEVSAESGERAGVRCRIQRNADSFRTDLHPDLKADFILANPPFNMSDWGGENLRQDVRLKFGMPQISNGKECRRTPLQSRCRVK
jgi:type I restriction enzyme M protein